MRTPGNIEPLPRDPNDGRLLAAGAKPETYEKIKTTGEGSTSAVPVNKFRRGVQHVILRIETDEKGVTKRDITGFPLLDLTEGLLVETVEDPGLGEKPGMIQVKTKLIRIVTKEELDKNLP